MTEHDLSTLIRDHVTHDEPHLGLSLDATIRRGRRRERGRRAMVGVAAASVAGVLAFTTFSGPGLFGAGDERRGTRPLQARTPTTTRRRCRRSSTTRSATRCRRASRLFPTARSGPTTSRGTCSPPSTTTRRTAGMAPTTGTRTTCSPHHSSTPRPRRRVTTSRACAEDVEAGVYLTCEVHMVDGDVVVTRTGALQRDGSGWSRTVQDLSTADPDTLWFHATGRDDPLGDSGRPQQRDGQGTGPGVGSTGVAGPGGRPRAHRDAPGPGVPTTAHRPGDRVHLDPPRRASRGQVPDCVHVTGSES